VDVGDRVVAGQLLGQMDPVDLDERIRALDVAYQRTEAAAREAELRRNVAQAQAERSEQQLAVRSTSEEIVDPTSLWLVCIVVWSVTARRCSTSAAPKVIAALA